jgi:hypothetical protein
MVREIARRTRLAGQNKKNPFLASHIRRLFSLWAGPESPLNKLMMLTAVTLCFTAFPRCDELLSLQWDQIRFVGQSHMELFIEHQKNDQYREGMWKIVPRVGGACCPVALVERLLDEGRYDFLGPGALIRFSVILGARQYISGSSLITAQFSDGLRRPLQFWGSIRISMARIRVGGAVLLGRLRLRSPIACSRNMAAGVLSAPRTATWSAVSRRACLSHRTWDFSPAPQFLNSKLLNVKPGSPPSLQVCPPFPPCRLTCSLADRLCFFSFYCPSNPCFVSSFLLPSFFILSFFHLPLFSVLLCITSHLFLLIRLRLSISSACTCLRVLCSQRIVEFSMIAVN